MSNRIVNHPILGQLCEKKQIHFSFNNQIFTAMEGDTIASALLANDIRTLRYHEESGNPRGIYCNIGHCFECRLTVNGKSNVRACLTLLEDRMTIESGSCLPNPLKSIWREQND